MSLLPSVVRTVRPNLGMARVPRHRWWCGCTAWIRGWATRKITNGYGEVPDGWCAQGRGSPSSATVSGRPTPVGRPALRYTGRPLGRGEGGHGQYGVDHLGGVGSVQCVPSKEEPVPHRPEHQVNEELIVGVGHLPALAAPPDHLADHDPAA